MKLIDPTGNPPARKFVRAPRLAAIDGLTVGVLSNGKANADRLLELTVAHFRERHGCTVLEFSRKLNASAPAPAETLVNLSGRCDFLLTAIGD